jgi:citronellol/citronellal dehydrogenase
MIPGVDAKQCRTPEILADAAYAIFGRDARTATGNVYIDEEVLAEAGVDDLGRYAVVPGTTKFLPDLFLD